MTHMVGSYAPKLTAQSYTTPLEDAPSGMTGRGSYHVNSLFTDDDKNEHLKVIFIAYYFIGLLSTVNLNLGDKN
jgi:hypothetical protein